MCLWCIHVRNAKWPTSQLRYFQVPSRIATSKRKSEKSFLPSSDSSVSCASKWERIWIILQLESGVADFPGLAYLEPTLGFALTTFLLCCWTTRMSLWERELRFPCHPFWDICHIALALAKKFVWSVMLNLRDISAYCVCMVHVLFVVHQWTSTYCLGVVIRSAMVAAVFHLSHTHTSLVHMEYLPLPSLTDLVYPLR